MSVIAEKLRQCHHEYLTDVPVLIDGAEEIEQLAGKLVLAKAEAEAAGSLLLDVRDECIELRQALQRIVDWADAYPVTAFPEPDLKRAHEVLAACGMTLDSISASNMRHCLNGVREIALEALT